MYSKKLIDIFLTNFIEGSLNFYGILLIPKKTIHNHLIWSIDNPKDLPWSNSAIKLFITNKIQQFNKLVSGEFVSLSKYPTINEFNNLTILEVENKSYFSENFIKQVYKETKKSTNFTYTFPTDMFDFKGMFKNISGDITLYSDNVTFTNITIKNRFMREITVDYRIYLSEPKLLTTKNELIKQFDNYLEFDNFLRELSNSNDEYFSGSFSYDYSSPINDLIINTPTIFNSDDMYITDDFDIKLY